MKKLVLKNKKVAKYIKEFFAQTLYAPVEDGEHTVTITAWDYDCDEDKTLKDGSPKFWVKLTCQFEDGQSQDVTFYNYGVTKLLNNLRDQGAVEGGLSFGETFDKLAKDQGKAKLWKYKKIYLDSNKVKQVTTDQIFCDPRTITSDQKINDEWYALNPWAVKDTDDDDIDVVDHI